MINIRSLRDLLRLFFIFKHEVRITVMLTFIVIVLGAFLLPNRYESTALLLVKPGRDSSTVPIEFADRQAIVIPSAQRDPILDEERMLTGRPIMRIVAEKYLAELSNGIGQEHLQRHPVLGGERHAGRSATGGSGGETLP